MVFRFATFDPAQDPDDFNPAFPPTPSSSPSVTLCQPCESTCTFTKTIVSRLVAAGASLVLKAPAFECDGQEIQDQNEEMPSHGINFDVPPEFRQRQLKEFTLEELKAASQNFSYQKIIGRGGSGFVYEGQLADGSLVAIKRWTKGHQGVIEFEREVMIGRIIPPRHNLLPLLGFCRTSKSRDLLLVSPLMINRSVDSLLRGRPKTRHPVDWLTRRKIAAGAARGLSRLHDLNIVHRDIKPSNIMLDEEFEPRIGDFGLAKIINCRHGGYFGLAKIIKYSYHVKDICGTLGYMAPEYLHNGRYSMKTDVFAFGVTLLEIVTGRRAVVRTKRENECGGWLPDWVKGLLVSGMREIIVDPNLQGEYDREEIEKVIQLALLCTQLDPRRRPSMAQVVRILEGHSIDEGWVEYHHSEEYLTPLCLDQASYWSSSDTIYL